MPRAGLSPDAVVDAALALIDEEGADALTLAAVATRAGVKTPSLYKHVQSLEDLRRRVGLAVMEEMNARLREAVLGRSGDDAVRGLMRAYRRYATEHPIRYALFPRAPLTDPALAATGHQLMEVFTAVLRGYGLTGADALHAVRGLRAAAHGFAALEAAGAFGAKEKLNTSYERLVDGLIAGLRAR